MVGFASALKRNFDKTGDLELLKAVIPNYKAQFIDYTLGKLPDQGAKWLPDADCILGLGLIPIISHVTFGFMSPPRPRRTQTRALTPQSNQPISQPTNPTNPTNQSANQPTDPPCLSQCAS